MSALMRGELERLAYLAAIAKSEDHFGSLWSFNRDFRLRSKKILVGPPIGYIVEVVAKRFTTSVELLRSRDREQNSISLRRQIAMYLIRKLTNHSFPEIGDYFYRDHSTVIHARDLIKRRAAEEPGFMRMLLELESSITANAPRLRPEPT